MKFDNPTVTRIVSGFLGICILLYVIYQAFGFSFSSVKTETAMYTQISDSIDVSAWFVRDETIVSSSYTGTTSFIASEGEKVATGDVIAEVYYSSGDASVQRQIEQIDAEISSLEKLVQTQDTYSADSELLGTQINAEIDNLVQSIAKGELDYISDYKNELQYLISKKKIVTGQEDTSVYSERITELEEEKDELESGLENIGYISSPSSGYFISSTDGYEGSFDFDNIEDITVSDLENIEQTSVVDEDDIKIAEGFTWYITAIIDEDEKIKLGDKSSVKIEILNADVSQIPATVVSINEDEETGNYALVLSCNYNTEEIIPMRYEEIQIIIAQYEGILVNPNAVYFEDVEETVTDEDGNITETIIHENVMGVYIKYGQKITFVQVFSDINVNNYLLCKTSLTDEEKALLYTKNTLSLYDEIIVEGSNLYDGKFLWLCEGKLF